MIKSHHRLIKDVAAKFLAAAAMAGCVLLWSCEGSKKESYGKKGVELAMQHYDALLQKMDTDSIAHLFTVNGKLGEMATGRDSIKKFLSSFKNVRVLLQHSSSDSITINGDTAIQKGSYRQTDLVSGKDTVRVAGAYTATWVWLNNRWYIQQMATVPK